MRYTDQTIDIDGITTNQITIRTAKKLFESGKPIYLLACKIAIPNPWVQPMKMDNESTNEDFSTLINSFTNYSCNSEMGNYPIFFTSVDNVGLTNKHRYSLHKSVRYSGYKVDIKHKTIFMSHEHIPTSEMMELKNKFNYVIQTEI